MHDPVPAPGDAIWIRQQRWRVLQTWRDRRVLWLDVAGHGERRTFLAPFDRPAAEAPRSRPVRVRPRRALAALVALNARSFGPTTILSAVSARIDVLPHQLAPGLALAAGTRRVLIADEVGLGKTIQAGLAIAEAVRRRPTARVLVLTPASLVAQWRAELADRFALTTTFADRAGLDELSRAGRFGASPWDRRGIWIASPDFLKQPHVAGALPALPWDLLVIDEAHDVCGRSERHALCDLLGRSACQLLLLTASPHSGDASRFQRLLDLGRLPARDDDLMVFRRTRAMLGGGATRVVRWRMAAPSPAEARLFGALAAYEQDLVARAHIERRGAALLVLSIFRKRALSTPHAVARSIWRRLTWLETNGQTSNSPVTAAQARLPFDDIPDDLDDDEREAIAATLGIDAGWEQVRLQRLAEAADRATASASKLRQLVRLLTRSTEPVVVFTEFRDSLAALAARLAGVRTLAIMHGGLSGDARARELARFLNGEATTLLATDVAGQGLNLHARSRWVIGLELPWQPHRLEQRIGRVDRIGQRRRPHLTLMVARHPMESTVLARLAARTLVARSAIGEAICGAVDPALLTMAETLIGGRALVEDQSHPPVVAMAPRRWHRLSVVSARSIDTSRRRSRLLRTHDEGAHGEHGWPRGRPLIARLGRCPGWWPGDGRAMFVFLVTVLDASGIPTGRRIRAVTARAWPDQADEQRAVIESARALVHAGAVQACRRYSRRRTHAAEAAEVARALQASLIATIDGGRGDQPGLFDQRFERLSRDTRAQLDIIAREIDERVVPATPALAMPPATSLEIILHLD